MKNVAEVNFDLCIELAALREENERLKSESFEELYNAAIDERDALREELAASRLNEYNAQVKMSEQHDKLTAAEQRNAELIELLLKSKDILCGIWDKSYDHEADDALAALALIDDIDAALKPTESGASE